MCKGGQVCDEPLPIRVYWSGHIMRRLEGRKGLFRRVWGDEGFVTFLVELWRCVHA